jgi:DnaK suppressor protein
LRERQGITVIDKRKRPIRVKSGKSVQAATGLSAADLEHFKEMLLRKRTEILGNVNEIEDEELKKSRLDACGDLSSMPIHMADIGTDNYEQEFALGLMDSERQLIKEIDDALQRIEQKTYGICEATKKPIAKARLEAKPWARYCIEYAKKLETK